MGVYFNNSGLRYYQNTLLRNRNHVYNSNRIMDKDNIVRCKKLQFVRFEKYDGVEVWINPLTVAWLIQSRHEGYTVVAFPGDDDAFVDVKGEVMDVMDRLTDA